VNGKERSADLFSRSALRSMFRMRQPAVLSECEVRDRRKMNVQLKANEENHDRAQRRKNEAGGMISIV
jgi:hypothetical protein